MCEAFSCVWTFSVCSHASFCVYFIACTHSLRSCVVCVCTLSLRSCLCVKWHVQTRFAPVFVFTYTHSLRSCCVCVCRHYFPMDERADYMMEAFLDEQNTLIRPLVSRKLALVNLLDQRAVSIERILDEKRKKKTFDCTNLEDQLEQLSNEKVTVCLQLLDLVRRPYDTILEVEASLRAATVEDQDAPAAPPRTRSRVSAPSPPEAELWCSCHKPDDGRQMIGCDNPKCEVTWWHTDCLAEYIATHKIGVQPPTDDSQKWSCPICIASEHENGNLVEKKRRRRTIQ